MLDLASPRNINIPDMSAPEPQDYLYDVIVSLPIGIDAEILEKRAQTTLGLSAEVASKLVQHLRQSRQVKIKAEVSKETADEFQAKFSAIGFIAESRHSLTLKPIVSEEPNERFKCPVCGDRSELTTDRQCSNCGVFVDKVSQETLMRKEILAKEKAKLHAQQRIEADHSRKQEQEALEKRIRAEIRAELEKQYGPEKTANDTILGGRYAKLALPALLVISTFAAFHAGQASVPANDMRDLPATASGPSAPQQLVENFLRGSAKMGQLMAQQGEGKSISELLAQAQQEVRLSNPGGSPAKTLGDISSSARNQLHPEDSLIITAQAAQSVEKTALIEPAEKLQLAHQLISQLGEQGQIDRAREVLLGAYLGPGQSANLGQTLQIRQMHLAVEAWSAVSGREKPATEQIDALNKLISDLPIATEQALAFALTGNILSQGNSPQFSAAEAFFHLAQQRLKETGNSPESTRVAHQLLSLRGESLYHTLRWQVSSGSPSQASLTLRQLSALAETGSGPSASILWLYRTAGHKLLGETAAMNDSLEKLRQALLNSNSGQAQLLMLKEHRISQLLGTSLEVQNLVAQSLKRAIDNKEAEPERALMDATLLYRSIGSSELATESANAMQTLRII